MGLSCFRLWIGLTAIAVCGCSFFFSLDDINYSGVLQCAVILWLAGGVAGFFADLLNGGPGSFI
jgi:hypothetical protein